MKINLLKIISHLPKWDSIFYLLKAALSPDERIAKFAFQEINNWRSHYNKSFLSPTTLQKTNLLALLAENVVRFDVNLFRELVDIIAHR